MILCTQIHLYSWFNSCSQEKLCSSTYTSHFFGYNFVISNRFLGQLHSHRNLINFLASCSAHNILKKQIKIKSCVCWIFSCAVNSAGVGWFEPKELFLQKNFCSRRSFVAIVVQSYFLEQPRRCDYPKPLSRTVEACARVCPILFTTSSKTCSYMLLKYPKCLEIGTQKQR